MSLDFNLAGPSDYVSSNTNADSTPATGPGWFDTLLSTAGKVAQTASTWKELVAPISAVQSPAFGLGSVAPQGPSVAGAVPGSPALNLGNPMVYIVGGALLLLLVFVLKKR